MARIKPNKPPKPPSPPPSPPPPPPPVTTSVTANSAYRHLGNTDRESFVTAMRRTVTTSNPPFLAELDAMYIALAAGEVTRLAVPMSWMECKNSTWPTCGVPTSAKNPWSVTGPGDAGQTGRWAKYSSYEAAAKDWADLVVNGSPYRNAVSIKDFVHIYAPASDNNDEAAYVQTIVDGVNALPLVGSIPAPTPEPVQDVLSLIFGGKPFTIGATYGQEITWSCPGCYDYFSAYGLDTAHHWAYDVSAVAGEGALLYAPFNGTITCAGTGVGNGSWGTGCAAFPRQNNYGSPNPNGVGAGRLEILHENGSASLILGHALSSSVRAGQSVKRGDVIGKEGGMNASHVHVEGRYANGTKIGDPRVLFGGGSSYALPVDIPQPDNTPPYVIVKATRKTPVLQRGNPDSPKVNDDLEVGTEFQSQHQVIGVDGRWYWVGLYKGRVLVDDTAIVRVVTS